MTVLQAPVQAVEALDAVLINMSFSQRVVSVIASFHTLTLLRAARGVAPDLVHGISLVPVMADDGS